MPPPRIGELLHPAPLAAVAILVVNDHFLKGSGLLPAWLTGKLSDFAGLFFFPLLLTALWRTARWLGGCRAQRDGTHLVPRARAREAPGAGLARRRDLGLTRRALAIAVGATGIAFAALKLSPALAARAGAIADPTDLAALVMLLPAWWIGRREIRNEIRRGTTAP